MCPKDICYRLNGVGIVGVNSITWIIWINLNLVAIQPNDRNPIELEKRKRQSHLWTRNLNNSINYVEWDNHTRIGPHSGSQPQWISQRFCAILIESRQANRLYKIIAKTVCVVHASHFDMNNFRFWRLNFTWSKGALVEWNIETVPLCCDWNLCSSFALRIY